MYILTILGLFLSLHSSNGFYVANSTGPMEQLVNEGASASIAFVTDNETSVVWTHMDTDAIIGRSDEGSFLLLGDSSFYSASASTDEGQTKYSLSLKASRLTEGVYRATYTCPHPHPNGTVFFTVGLNVTTPKSGLISKTNHSLCCLNASVSSSCLPACDPVSLNFISFPFSSCVDDMDSLRTCTMAKRNHVRCCQRRGVSGSCLELCHNAGSVNASGCETQLRDVVQCLYEGQEEIPSPPRNIFVETTSRTNIVVHWNIPLENAGLLTGYQLIYRLQGSADSNMKLVTRNTLKQSLTVEKNKRYEVEVRAVGVHGSSYPSETVTVSTVAEYFYPDVGNTTSVDACCEKERVDSKCRQELCVGIPRQLSLSQVFLCIKDWPRIVKCFAGGRDHTPCCTENGVEKKCSKYCSGKEVDTKQAEISCMINFRIIASCFDAGVRTVPSPPQKLRTTLVLSTSIKLAWDAPDHSGSPKVNLKYAVVYRNLNAGTNLNVTGLNQTSVTLDDLGEGLTYEMSVYAYNPHGSSLRSSSLRVLTHSVAPIDSKPSPPYDPRQCCINQKVPDACLNACDLTKVTAIPPESCKSSIMKMTRCLADGRDHSSCCQRDSRINPNCRFMCTIDSSSDPAVSSVWGCLSTYSLFGLRTCFASGHSILPSRPRNLRLLTIQQTAAKLIWDLPSRYPDLKGYRLYVTANNDTTVKTEASLTHSQSLSGLNPNTEYSVRVTAFTTRAYESLPSNTINFRTLPALPAEWYKHRDPNFDRHNVTTCCARSTVSEACQPLCDPSNASMVMTWTAESARSCLTDVGKILRCAADKRDHRACCQSRRVPVFCLSMCVGATSAETTMSAVCLHFFPEIRSCFLDGYELLPSTPLVEEVRTLTQSSVRISFSEPEQNKMMPGVLYYVYYQKAGDTVWSVRPKVTSPLVLDRLSTSTSYALFLIAVSNNGTSLPSAIYDVTTFANSPFHVYIVVLPGLLVKQYDQVTMSCQTALTETATYSWYHEGKLMTSSAGVLKMNVTRDSVGQYVCVSKALNKTVTRSVYLKVQYGIQAFPQQALVRAGLYSSVTLACTFSGFPKTITWLDKAGKEITPTKQFSITTKSNQHFEESQLTIFRVVAALYGEYQCKGNNYYGPAYGKIRLVDLSYIAPLTTASPKPATGVKDAKTCCQAASVSSSCIPGCDFSVTADFFQNNPNCIYEFSRIYHCLTDLRDHSKCCQRRKVPSYCWPVCSGQEPSLNKLTFQCFAPTYAQLTLQCMKEGAEIPTAPLAVKVVAQTRTSLTVAWFPPSQMAANVDSYQIRLKDLDGRSSDTQVTADKAKRSHTVSGLPSGHTYLVSVRAKSRGGDSQFSTPYRAFTLGSPRPPVNLHAQLIGGVSIKLSWEMPTFSSVKATSFLVYWAAEEDETLKKNKTSKQEFVFPCLNPKTLYKFQVSAVNDEGSSAKSQEGMKKTTTSDNPHCKTRTKTVTKYGTNNSGVIVVVILLLILVVGLTAMATFVYVNRRNPRYSWPQWIRRLPGMVSSRPPVRDDFNNPIRFSNLDVADDEEDSRMGETRERLPPFEQLTTFA